MAESDRRDRHRAQRHCRQGGDGDRAGRRRFARRSARRAGRAGSRSHRRQGRAGGARRRRRRQLGGLARLGRQARPDRQLRQCLGTGAAVRAAGTGAARLLVPHPPDPVRLLRDTRGDAGLGGALVRVDARRLDQGARSAPAFRWPRRRRRIARSRGARRPGRRCRFLECSRIAMLGCPRTACAGDGAQERTRTSTPLRAPAPEAGASTNSATWAQIEGNQFGRAGDLAAAGPLVNAVRDGQRLGPWTTSDPVW